MDELAWVEPVRIARRRGAPVTPEMMGEDQHDPFCNIIWFDQGGTTGWAVFSIWPEAMTEPDVRILASIAAWSAGEFTGTEASMTDQMMDLVNAWDERTFVGCEDFILQKLLMGRELLSPVRIAARFEDRMYRAKLLGQLQPPQMPSLAMSKVTDDRLQRWGFWNRLAGQPHARDAVRHAITFASRLKEVNLKSLSR